MLIAKVGDLAAGVCLCVPTPPGPFPATGVITTGATNFFVEGVPAAQAAISTVSFPCGTAIITGATMINSSSAPLARTGDSISGCANGVIQGTSQIISI